MIARSSGFVTVWMDFNPARYFGLKPRSVELGDGVFVRFVWVDYSHYLILVGLVFDGCENMFVLYNRVYDAYNALEDYFESQHDVLDMLE